MVRGSARVTVKVYLCLLYGTVVGTMSSNSVADLSAMEVAMETALRQAGNGSHPGLAAQPDAAVAEQQWRPGDCMDHPGEPRSETLFF